MAAKKVFLKRGYAYALLPVVMTVSFCALLFAGSDTQDKPAEGRPDAAHQEEKMAQNSTTHLPEPEYTGRVSVEEALSRRKSVREFTDRKLSLKQTSQLLWACAGTNAVSGATRTYPSAGGLYPLEFYLVAGNVADITPGIYRYSPTGHSLHLVERGDFRRELAHAALGQRWIEKAPASMVIAAVYRKTTRVYGERGRIRYVHMDAGHSAQNVYLEAAALGLGTVAIGAFNDEMVKEVLGLTRAEPLYLFPVGEPAE